ncbi:MAG: hypothetical protein RIG61_07260 [Deltaproteobacteria bacterium]
MEKYILIYPALFAVGFVNGAMRELAYGKYLDEYPRHVVGTITGTILIGLVIYAINYFWPFQGRRQAFLVGVVWAALTIIFESAMILFMMKKGISHVLREYDVTEGRLWPFVLLFVIIFPVLIA